MSAARRMSRPDVTVRSVCMPVPLFGSGHHVAQMTFELCRAPGTHGRAPLGRYNITLTAMGVPDGVFATTGPLRDAVWFPQDMSCVIWRSPWERGFLSSKTTMP